MAEWLTHVCLGYAVFTVASWNVGWLDEQWIAVGIVGSLLPDLNRLDLLISSDLVTEITHVPFDWNGLHTVGGLVLLAGIGALLFDRTQHQWRTFRLLFAGGLAHVLVDLPQRYADGEMLTHLYVFPFTSWRGATPGWYVSADRWVVVIALVTALLVFLWDRYRTNAASITSGE